MKVLMTADTVGGVWTYCLDLARALGEQGVEVALATMGMAARPEQRAAAEAIASLSLYESTYKLEWMEDPWRDVEEAGRWLLELAGVVQPDLVHLNGYAHGALAWCCPVLMVGHSCVLSWWQAVKREPAPSGWHRYRVMVRHGLHAADTVAAPTRAMLKALERHYGMLPRGRVIPNGREAGLYQPWVKEPLVLSAGRLWDEAKNVGALEQAAGGLKWPVFVAGATCSPDGREMRARHVQLLGALSGEELGAWYARAAIYCLPARYEPFGLSALEAAMAGCALVLGDIESLREVWGNAAMFVTPDDSEELAATVNWLIDRPVDRRVMAEKARRRAAEYSMERMADGYMAAYRELIGARAGRLSCGSFARVP